MRNRLLAILAVVFLLCWSVGITTFSAKSVKQARSAAVTVRPVDFGDQNDYDSGSDSDWDSGGSDYDSGSSSYDDDDDDDDHYYSGSTSRSGGGSSGGSLSEGIIAAIVIIAVVAYALLKKDKGNNNTPATPQTNGTPHNIKQRAGRNVVMPDRTSEISNAIQQDDPDFSAEDFLAFARFVFVTIQDGWSNRDLQPVRIYLHDNLFNQTQKQVERKIQNGVINKVENVAVSTAYLTAYRKDKSLEYVTVYLNARLTDYEINEKTGAVLRGDPSARYENRYLLKFVRNSGVTTNAVNSDLQAHNCPNCGAVLQMSNSGKCDYCDSVITTGEYSWVLSEYSSVRDDTVDAGVHYEKKKKPQNDRNNQNNTMNPMDPMNPMNPMNQPPANGQQPPNNQ